MANDGSSDTMARSNGHADADPLLPPENGWPFAFRKKPVAEQNHPGDKREWPVPELYVTGHNGARVITGLMALAIAGGVVLWILEAKQRFNVPALVCDGCAPPDWFRWAQLLLAVVGIAAGLVMVAYAAHFTIREIVWRRWRGVTITFGVLAAAWTVVWWTDRFWI